MAKCRGYYQRKEFMEKKMNPIDILKRKILDFLVPFIEGSKKKVKRKKNG